MCYSFFMKKSHPRRTPSNLEKEIWQSVIEKIYGTKSKEEIEGLLTSLITFQEREHIARRLAVRSLLAQGMSYTKIGALLWVSPLTISAIKKSEIDKGGYRSYQDRKQANSEATPKNQPALQESLLHAWLNDVAFIIENGPRISGPRWRFLQNRHMAPKRRPPTE